MCHVFAHTNLNALVLRREEIRMFIVKSATQNEIVNNADVHNTYLYRNNDGDIYRKNIVILPESWYAKVNMYDKNLLYRLREVGRNENISFTEIS